MNFFIVDHLLHKPFTASSVFHFQVKYFIKGINFHYVTANPSFFV